MAPLPDVAPVIRAAAPEPIAVTEPRGERRPDRRDDGRSERPRESNQRDKTPRQERPRDDRGDRRRDDRPREARGDTQVVGMGDHMPEFLSRAVPKIGSTSDT
jgi:hypothetical protein